VNNFRLLLLSAFARVLDIMAKLAIWSSQVSPIFAPTGACARPWALTTVNLASASVAPIGRMACVPIQTRMGCSVRTTRPGGEKFNVCLQSQFAAGV